MELNHNGIERFGCGQPPPKALERVTCLRCLRKMFPGKNERDLNLVVVEAATYNAVQKQVAATYREPV